MKHILIISLLLLSSFIGFAQNYYQEFPISTVVNINGSQYQLVCSTYDSTLQTTVIYSSPWINYIIVAAGISPGKVVFTTWVNLGQQNGDYGFIVYDYLLHQFAVNWIHGSIASNQKVFLGSGVKWFAELIQTEFASNDYSFRDKSYRYNIQYHSWSSVSFPYAEFGNNPYSGGNVSTPGNNEWIYFVEDTDEGDFYFYDARWGGSAYFGSGCAGWGYGMTDDYFYMDTGCADDFVFASYDAEIGGFYEYNRDNLVGSHTHGIFAAYDQSNNFGSPTFFFVFDEAIHQWITDSVTSDNISNVLIKNRVLVYIDQTVGFSKKIFYMVHNPILHTWVKDSTTIAGVASGLTIEGGTVKWTDSNGLNLRGYDINLGWGNYPTPLFMYFHLVDLSSQGFPMVHVRNYSIGTDNVYFDMGDGTISQGNQHVMWRHYRDSGTYNICIYDSSGANSYCQQVTMNICSSSGTMTLSKDTICQGDSVVLSLNNYVGAIQWQSQTNYGPWIDETGAGSNMNNYVLYPSKSSKYRASVTNGTCISAISNVKNLKVNETIANALISDSLVTTCSGQYVLLFIANVNASFQWQQNLGSGWSNILNATNYNYATNLTSNALYRVITTSGNCFLDTSSVISVIVDSVPSLPVTVPDFTCGPGMVDLQASSNGTINWFDYYVSDSLLHTGFTYSPFITSSTTYKVKATNGVTATAGYADNSIGNMGTMSNEEKGLRFYCAEPATLTAVYIYPLQTGTIYIKLYDAYTGQFISYATQYVTGGSGKTKIKWNNYSLKGNRTYDMKVDVTSVPLEINTSGISYPITTSGVPITILGYVDSFFHDTSDFYNIYDITLSTRCQTNAVNVQGSVYPLFVNATVVPLSPVVFCQGDSVKLNTTPTGNYTYQWLKNGIPTGSIGNYYTAKTAGTYQVVMNNSSGCVDTSSSVNVRVPCIHTFDAEEKSEISNSTEPQFNFHYSSLTRELNFDIKLIEDESYTLLLMDQTGRELLRTDQELLKGENSFSINVQKYSSGLYILKLQSENNRFVKRWMKN